MPGRDELQAERERQARADLQRLQGTSHEEGPDDPIEKWGKLIGRTLGVLFLVYLIYWLSTKIL